MTAWQIVLVAAIACFALKLVGYLIPAKVLERPVIARTAGLVTVALLAALVAVQTLASGTTIAFDARIPALGVAAILFALRVPFVLVVIAAAATAALIRLLLP